MNEEFLQYIWKYRLFSNNETTEGQKIQIISTGKWNTDAGPDFFNAKIKIGTTLWSGNVEIHINSSDWLKHGHQTDKKYDNVILHVVLNHDEEISLKRGELIPVFIPKLLDGIETNYNKLLARNKWPACFDKISNVDDIYWVSAISGLMIERLANKTQEIETLLIRNNNNWNETFYQSLAKNFGFKVNSVPFEMLARSLPLSIIAKHANNLKQIEALLFGQSGLLHNELIGDDYFLELRNEYQFLSAKYKLKVLEGHIWKFMRLRPVNFPTVRIAQFAKLLYRSKALFSKITDTQEVHKLKALFNIEASEYWKNHYKFNKPSSKTAKQLGESSKNNLLINTVVPFLFVYGEMQNKPRLKERALELLEKIPAEDNHIVKRWAKLGFKARNAFESQALIQLKNVYCDHKKCLNCKIGLKVISA